MAWRIHEAVTRGVIDNTVEGRTTGQVWLAGRHEPLVLTLTGDCWRDLAGTQLWFENPLPVAASDSSTLASNQTGIVGDMSASRKSKVPVPGEQRIHRLNPSQSRIPYEWKNTLYLEWFSEINGRVVIESSTYLLRISPHEWTMDEDAEDAQKLANLNAMRDFMAQLIRRRDATDSDQELDEFEWEERLKESDRLTDAYQEVLEKYMEDADSERKEAFVMGWDGLLDALAERDEALENEFPGLSQASGAQADPSFWDDEDPDEEIFDDEDDDADHPLQIQAEELAMRAMDVLQAHDDPGTPAYQLVTCLLQVSGKLAGALNVHDSDYEAETGFILAMLKRGLNALNEALGACQILMVAADDPDHLASLAHLRSSMFSIRDDIVEMRRQLK